MEEPANPGGGGGHGGGSGVSSAAAEGGGSVGAGSSVDDLDELWPSRPSKVAAMLAQIWVTLGILGLGFTDLWIIPLCCSLDPEIWDLRIHLDGVDNLERRLGRDDITLMNLHTLIETQGYSFTETMYCRKGEDMVMIENNAQIYELLDHFESTKVLNLTVKRGRPKKAVAKEVKNADEGIAGSQSASCIINYTDPVVYDLSPPLVYAVDGEGTVFPSQNSYFATQESRNDEKGKGIQNLDSDEDIDIGREYEDMDFDMGEVDFNMMEEMRRKEQSEIAERIEEMRQQRMDHLLHCEGDTDIEDLFVTEEIVAEAIPEPVAVPVPAHEKKMKRKGPTVRSHSALHIDELIDWKPLPDEDAGQVKLLLKLQGKLHLQGNLRLLLKLPEQHLC
ncbi:hypothetical protein ACQ4PT_019635 [Festuca glaucescens]